MSAEHDHEQIGGALPEAGSKIALVSGLTLLAGVLLSVIAVGGVFYYQQTGRLNAQLRTANGEIKQKSVALVDMQTQIDTLSEQLYALRSYAAAHSGQPGELPVARAQPVTHAAREAPLAPIASKENPVAVLPVPQVAKTLPKRVTEDCELVGKAPAEQARTLQRCVTAMDAPVARRPLR